MTATAKTTPAEALSRKWERLSTWKQIGAFVIGAVITTITGVTTMYGIVQRERALGPRMTAAEVRLDADQASLDTVGLRLTGVESKTDTIGRRLESVSAEVVRNRAIGEATLESVLKILCREDGGSPAFCDAQALAETRALTSGGGP